MEPTDTKQKYNRINFSLEPSNIVNGEISLNFENDKAIIKIDAEVNISPKPEYEDMVLNKSAKWCFGDIYINNNLSTFDFDIVHDGENGDIISGGSIEEFSYEHRRLGTVNVKLLLIETEIV